MENKIVYFNSLLIICILGECMFFCSGSKTLLFCSEHSCRTNQYNVALIHVFQGAFICVVSLDSLRPVGIQKYTNAHHNLLAAIITMDFGDRNAYIVHCLDVI